MKYLCATESKRSLWYEHIEYIDSLKLFNEKKDAAMHGGSSISVDLQ